MIKKKSYKNMTAQQVADRFTKRGIIYIVLLIFVSFDMLLCDYLVLTYGLDETIKTLFMLLMIMSLLLILIHRRIELGTLVGIMMYHCDLEKFLTVYDLIASKKIFDDDLQMIRSHYQVALTYCADFNTAENSFLAERGKKKNKWLKVNDMANLAILYQMYGKNQEFDKLYNEVMWAINTKRPNKRPKYVERIRTGIEAKRLTMVGNYAAAADIYRSRILDPGLSKYTFYMVINNIFLGDIELMLGNKMEAAVAYGYAIQHAPQMTFVQSRIPKYEELKKEFSK